MGIFDIVAAPIKPFTDLLKPPSPPPAPDYVGAAKEQGIANKEAAISSSRLNNPNVFNPYGTQTWQEGATPDSRPTVTQTLSPDQQLLLNQSNQMRGLLGGLGIQGATALQDVLGRNLDLGGLPTAPGSAQETRDAVTNAMMSRVNEDTSNAKGLMNSQLIAAGIRPGSKAYDDRMALIDRGYNDARQQAILAAGQEAQRSFGMDTEARKNAMAELLAQRQTPLNEVNALMSGSQVNNPFAVPGTSQNANIQAAPLYNAIMQRGQYDTDVYNTKVGQQNAILQGLFGLGGAAMGGL